MYAPGNEHPDGKKISDTDFDVCDDVDEQKVVVFARLLWTEDEEDFTKLECLRTGL